MAAYFIGDMRKLMDWFLFEKYLKEKYSSEYKEQLSLKYFVK